MSESDSAVVAAIRMALERTTSVTAVSCSPEAAALLRNLDKRIREETGLPVCIADDPLCFVVLGIGKVLSDLNLLRRISVE